MAFNSRIAVEGSKLTAGCHVQIPIPVNYLFTADNIVENTQDHVLPPGVLTFQDLGVEPKKVTEGFPIEHLRHYRVGGYDFGEQHSSTSACFLPIRTMQAVIAMHRTTANTMQRLLPPLCLSEASWQSTAPAAVTADGILAMLIRPRQLTSLVSMQAQLQRLPALVGLAMVGRALWSEMSYRRSAGQLASKRCIAEPHRKRVFNSPYQDIDVLRS